MTNIESMPSESPDTNRNEMKQEKNEVKRETTERLQKLQPEISAWDPEKEDPAFAAERAMITTLPDVFKDRDNPLRWVSEGGMRTNPTSEMIRYFTTTPVRVQYNPGTRLWEYQTGGADTPWKTVEENTRLIGISYPTSGREMVDIARRANMARKNKKRE